MTKFTFIFRVIRGCWAIITPESSITKTLNYSLSAPLCIWTSCAIACVCELFKRCICVSSIFTFCRWNWAKRTVASNAFYRFNSTGWTIVSCRTDLALVRTFSSFEKSCLTWNRSWGSLRTIISRWALITLTSWVPEWIGLLWAWNTIVTCITSFVFFVEGIVTHSVFIAVVATFTRNAYSLAD